jgi:hypothetical protein
MLLHLVAAEQFRSQRRLVHSALCFPVFSVKARQYPGQVPENGFVAQFQ